MPTASQTSKIAIIGAGSVGSAIAFSLVVNPVASEILLVDLATDLRDAQVADLSDVAFHQSSRIRAGTSQEAGQCDIIVITAGARQKDGQYFHLPHLWT
jgi:L-lactate dehydrogenase